MQINSERTSVIMTRIKIIAKILLLEKRKDRRRVAYMEGGRVALRTLPEEVIRVLQPLPTRHPSGCSSEFT